MSKWKVLITETLTRTVEVEVGTSGKEAALDAVRAKYKRGEIILGADDYCGTDFEVQADDQNRESGEQITGSKFMCRAAEGGYCQRWLRACVDWTNCNLSSCGAPCPCRLYSSPRDNPNCDNCEHKRWKEENYID